MKNIVKIFMLGALIGLSSCSDSEALIDQVLDSVDDETGVFLRTLQAPQDLVSLTNEVNNVILMEVEVQQGNGSFVPDFKEVRAYIRLYADQDLAEPITTDDGAEIPEQLLSTFDPASFSIASNGLPRQEIAIPTQGIVDLYANSTLTPPSFIALRFEVEMSDGSVYTDTEVGAAVAGGIYYNSPFIYRIIFLPI